MSPLQACVVAERELQSLSLGDARRDRRARTLLAAMLESAASAVPAQQAATAATKGAYRFLENPRVSASAILDAHVQQTIERARTHPEVLAVQDTTAVSLKGLVDAEGLGPINDSKWSRGYLVHSTMLVSAGTGEVLGIASQQVWARTTKQSATERPDQRKKRARESEHWAIGQQNVAKAFGRTVEHGNWSSSNEGDPRVIAVFDREGDVFEVLEELARLQHGFVIRAVHNRLIESDEPRYSLDEVERAPPLGTYEVPVPRRAGGKPRLARLTARAAEMRIRPPRNRGRKGAALPVNVVLVREETRTPDTEPLCWWLLTTEPIATAGDIERIVGMYRRRWLIEEFHMGLKTGSGIERRQFESFDVHARFLSLATVVAWQMLVLRATARSEPSRPAETVLTSTQLVVLRSLVPKLPARLTARDALRAIAMLGGFMGRKGDGEPGWRTLWWGFERILAAEYGYILAKERFGQ